MEAAKAEDTPPDYETLPQTLINVLPAPVNIDQFSKNIYQLKYKATGPEFPS